VCPDRLKHTYAAGSPGNLPLNMPPSQQQVGQIELAAKAIDLTTALLEATTSSGSLLKGAWEIGQWLGRERLNQYELLECMEKAKGLVFANESGQKFFDQIISGLDTRSVGPLFLQQSGSLGRLMAGDPNLSWIVSTVACLFQHHRDDRVVTEKLTAYIMENQRSRGQDQALTPRDAFTYNPEQTRLRAVVRKIVLSVWYNVVNTGCDTIPLPQELHSVCPKGHYLDPVDFGIVINTIHAQCPSKAILRTNHLLRDVLLWLLLHYDGTIVVNVSGQIVYKASFGNPHRELEVHVASACPENDDCTTAGRESYKILRHISGSFEEFLSGYSFPESSDQPQRPGVRQKLYDIPRSYPNDSAMWNKTLQILMKRSAQSMMRWLLEVPLSAQEGFSSPGFSADPGRSSSTEQTTVSSVLKRVPAMINLQWGSSSAFPSGVAFFNRPKDVVSPDDLDEKATRDMERKLKTLFESFPVLADLATKFSADCLCSDCSGQEHQLNSRQATHTTRLRLGCLKRTAVEEVLLLLAHAIADGFGVNDTSSVSDSAPIVEGMTFLLLELVEERQVCWDTWFTVASCVYLGCPFEKPVGYTHPAFGGTAFAAIQYGNLATQAPWLDLNQELTVRGCFALIGSRGRLGVITRSHDRHVQFRSVEENFAIIETENTEDTSPYCSRYKKDTSLVDHGLHVDDDESYMESDVILCQMDERFYRLLLRIKTQNHWRIVDPSDALSAVIRMLPSITCRHGTEPPSMSALTAKIYTMDEVVGRWPDVIQSNVSTSTANDGINPSGAIVHLSHILDTHSKKNIALALSVCPVTVTNVPKFTCSTCSLSHASKSERKPLRENESGNLRDRYIINLKPQMTNQEYAMRSHLIEQSNALGG
jgi:hypothetical protein